MPKPVFFYATGTAFLTQVFGLNVAPIGDITGELVASHNGNKFYWNGTITDDPFWRMLDPQVWDARKIDYPAATWPMGVSINIGVDMVVTQINNLPSGTPFCLGGYSQGAAVMSHVYDEIRTGSLTGRASSFKGGVMFGNPRRQQDFLAPELTWSGAWDVPGSTTGGSGCFPNRLSGCELGVWREYVNSDEIITSTGTSFTGAGWRTAVGFLTGQVDPIAAFISLIPGSGTYIGTQAALAIGSGFPGGHVGYPQLPPTGLNGLSSYERALTFLQSVAETVSTVSILPITHPSMNRTWTTCRTFPPA